MRQLPWRDLAGVLLVLLVAGCAGPQVLSPVERSNQPVTTAETPAPATPEPAPEAVSETALAPLTDPNDLWALLQAEERSFAVLLRHAIAPGTGDPATFRLEDCATQRNLSTEGRQQAAALGEAFRRRRIPVRQVLSSQWCRCLDTATLLNLGPVEPFAPLNSFFRDRSTAAAQTAQLRERLLREQASPGVVVMVTHQVNITALSGIVPASGEGIVVQIGDDRQIEILGRLNLASAQ